MRNLLRSMCWFRRITSVGVAFLLILAWLGATAPTANALTVTLGSGDELVFDHSGSKFTNIVGNGTATNDIVLYKNVVTVSGTSVDAVVKTTLTNSSITNYDAIGSASSNANNFQVNASIATAGGTVGFNFSFYESGTYTGAGTGNPVILSNVRMTSIDLDASGSSDFQFAEFTGFQKYTLNNPTNLTINATNKPKIRFTSTSNSNNSNVPGDKVMARYDAVQTLDVLMGNVKVASTNYFGISFGPWTDGNPVEYTNTYNTPPSSNNTSSYVATGQPYVLPLSIFGTYSDVDNNPFTKVIIKSLPSSGTLEYLSAGTWTAVTVNQVITTDDIDLGKLRFTGSSNTSITFQVNDSLVYSTSTYTASFLTVANSQTITFANPGTKSPSQTFASGATASSGLTVTLTSKTTGICTVSGLNITTVSNGMCEIVATQSGNSTYGAAAPVTQIFPVSSLTAQTITFNNPGTKSISDGTVSTSPTSTSGLSVTLTSLTPSVCTVSGTTITLVSTGTCQIKATQPGNGTYAPASPVIQNFEVTPITVTVTAPALTVYYGDPIPTVGNPTYSGFVNGDSSSDLTTTPTCTTTYTSTTDVSTGATTSCSGAVLNGYTFTYTSTPVTINKAPVVVTASSSTVDYGDSVPTISPTYSGFKNSDGPGALDTAPTCTTSYTDGTSAGASTTTSCSGASDTNYSFTYIAGSVTVNKATLTITASSHSVNTGASVPSITASYSGFVNSETSTVVSGVSCSTTYTNSSAAGNYPSSCTGATATNYQFLYVSGLVVASAGSNSSQTITFPNPGSQTYGPAITLATPPTASSGLSVTITSNSPSVCTVSGNVVTIVGIGTCSLSANQGGGTTGGTTYNPAATVTITFTVSAAPLVIAASSITVTYRDAVPSVGYSISGFVLGETSADLITLPVCSTTFVSTDSVTANRNTSCSGASASNYSFSYTNGTVTINKAALAVTASSHTVIIGDTTPTITAEYSGFRGTDSSSVISGQSCSTTYTNSSVTGSYPSSCTGGSATNYTINYVSGSVRATDGSEVLEQTITFNTPSNQTYGNGAFYISPSASSGLPVTVISNTPEVCVIENGVVRIVGVGACSLTASQSGNEEYLAAPNVTVTFNVGKATLIVTASSYKLTKGDVPPAISATVSGYVNGESYGVISGLRCVTAYSITSNKGTYSTSCSGATATNYTFIYVSGTIEVTEPVVTATPEPTPSVTPLKVLPQPINQVPLNKNGNPIANINAPASIDKGSGSSVKVRGLEVLQAISGDEGSPRTIRELATESISGFSSGSGTRIEIIGAKTTGQFIVAKGSIADPVAVAAALEESVKRTATNFAQITSASQIISPARTEIIGGVPNKYALEVFAASKLAEPKTVGQLNFENSTKWIKVSATVDTYKPGSVVYLAVTTDPIIFGAAVVDKYGKADFSGVLPVDLLSTGGHNIRIVGIRDLDGVSTDQDGKIQLAEETLIEIERFDPGTKATVKVMGANISGGLHAAIREVPLMKYEPWWTVWLAIWTAFLALLARRMGKVLSRKEKSVVYALVAIGSIPAFYLGWISATYSIMFWGIVAGLLGGFGAMYLPIHGSAEDREVRRRIKKKYEEIEDQVSDKFEEIKDRLDD